MSMHLDVHQVDVFTDRIFAGNPAAVVLSPDPLADAVMQDIAREMNLSETAFVGSVDHDAEEGVDAVSVRFFTPRREVPVCGHATLATHAVRAWTLGREQDEVVQVSPGARWRVRWEVREDETFVTMRQGPVEACRPVQGEAAQGLLRALCTDPAAVDAEDGFRVISTGHAKVLVRMRDEGALRGLAPDMGRLEAWSTATAVSGVFVFATRRGGDSFETAARMFAPALGIPEDPVNGSGHGPLGAWLDRAGGELRDAARAGFWSHMGWAAGRPGRVWTRVLGDTGFVEVGGRVTPVFRTRIDL